MHCDIYKFSKKDEMYAYIARPNYPHDIAENAKVTDALSVIPSTIRNTLGMATFVMHVDLAKREKLARVDIALVQEKLADQGYFLQFPPDPHASLDENNAHIPFSAVDC